jgi:RNA polymerase sigma-70 factor, ECF subfamily
VTAGAIGGMAVTLPHHGIGAEPLRAAAVRMGERVAAAVAAAGGRSDAGAERDRLLFEELVASQKERVFRVALSVLGPGRESEAEDVAQEAFVRAFRALPGFRGESRLSTWVHRLAFNLAVDHRRAAGRRPIGSGGGDEVMARLPARDPGSDPYRASRDAERRRAVRAALDGLPDEPRAVLHLHYWLGCTVREIGDLLDLPPGTVKSHLHRGRERLGKELADHAG